MVDWKKDDGLALKKMLASVLRTPGLKLDYNQIAGDVGESCSPKAVMHQVAGLKKFESGEAPASAVPNVTPKKGTPKTSPRKKNASTPSKANSKKRALKKEPMDDEDNDADVDYDELDPEPPTKKVKVEESEDEDEEQDEDLEEETAEDRAKRNGFIVYETNI